MAIGFDLFSDGGAANPGTSLSWNHTCTGSALALRVGTIGDLTSDLITGVTFNTVALTKLGVIQVPSDRFLTLWELLAPASGLHQIVVSASASIFIAGVAASYTGVTSSEAATTNTAASPATSVTGTVTTVANNAWTVAAFADDSGGAISGGTGTTSRGTNSVTALIIGDSNGALGAGAHTLQGTNGASNWGVVIAALTPSGAATFNPGWAYGATKTVGGVF